MKRNTGIPVPSQGTIGATRDPFGGERAGKFLLPTPAGPVDLRYFVEWRPRQWTPAVKFLIADPDRFVGKSVLEIGCRDGRMSCLFALLGASVTGVELKAVPVDNAWAEAARLGVRDRVGFANYDGDVANIPGGEYDYVFTKSVLVVVPDLERSLHGIANKLKPGGELLAAENLSGGPLLHAARWVKNYRYRGSHGHFHGVDDDFLASVNRALKIVGFQRFSGLVAALRARRVEPG